MYQYSLFALLPVRWLNALAIPPFSQGNLFQVLRLLPLCLTNGQTGE